MRALKDATGMSLAELAARTAHSKSAWHRYLNGTNSAPSSVEALGRLMPADLSELLELWTRAEPVSERFAAPRQPPRTSALARGPGAEEGSAEPPRADRRRHPLSRRSRLDDHRGIAAARGPARTDD